MRNEERIPLRQKIPRFKDSCSWRFPISKIPRFNDSPFLILKIAMHDLREKSHHLSLVALWKYIQTNDISLPMLRKNKGQILFKIAISAKGNSP